jgi:hypothetical protein
MLLSRFGLIVSGTKTNQRVVLLWIFVKSLYVQKIILKESVTTSNGAFMRKGNVDASMAPAVRAMGPDVEYVAER